jgi:hypothetical protein
MEPVLTISANGELAVADDEDEVELPEPPRLPVAVPEEPPAEDPEDDVPLPLDVEDVDALPVEPADTASPGESPASDAIVPLLGA